MENLRVWTRFSQQCHVVVSQNCPIELYFLKATRSSDYLILSYRLPVAGIRTQMKSHRHSLVLCHGRRLQVKRLCEAMRQLRRHGQHHCKQRSLLLVVHSAIKRWNYFATSGRTWRRSTTWKRTTPARSVAADLRTSTICFVTWGQFMEWSSLLFRVDCGVGSSGRMHGLTFLWKLINCLTVKSLILCWKRL